MADEPNDPFEANTNFTARPDNARLCGSLDDALDVTGASISLFGTYGRQTTLYATDDLAGSSESSQFDLGEGPHWQVLRTETAAEDRHPTEHRGLPALRREVHQATGIILSRLDTTATDAFARVRAYAFAAGRPVADLARDVVEHRLDFTDLPDYYLPKEQGASTWMIHPVKRASTPRSSLSPTPLRPTSTSSTYSTASCRNASRSSTPVPAG